MSMRRCPVCHATARVCDSRPQADLVRRNYVCPQGHRYTTAEMLVTGGDRVSGHVKRWLDQGRKDTKTLQKVRALLAEAS